MPALGPSQQGATVNLKAAGTPKSQGILQPELRLEAPLFLFSPSSCAGLPDEEEQ